MTTAAASPDFVLRRRIPAAPAAVFDAWLDADRVGRWMCPGAIVRTRAEIDPRVGGAFTIEMFEPDGRSYVHRGEYLRIDRPRELVFTWQSDATSGRATRVTVRLQPDGRDTELALEHATLPTAEAIQRHRDGWAVILDRLTQWLERSDDHGK